MSEPAPVLPPPPTLVLIEGGAAGAGGVAAAEVGLPLLAIVIVLVALLFMVGELLLPLIDHIFGTHTHSWFRRVVLWPARKIAGAAKALLQKIKAHLSQHLWLASPGVTRWLNARASGVERVTGVIAATAEWAYEAFIILRNSTIPRMIRNAQQWIVADIAWLWDRVTELREVVLDSRANINGMLRGLPWGTGGTFALAIRQWGGAFAHLWDQFFKFALPKLNALYNVRVPNLEQTMQRLVTWRDHFLDVTLPDILGRIRRLEDAIEGILTDPQVWVLTILGLSLTPVLGPGAMRRALNNSTCENVQSLEGDICALDPAGIQRLRRSLPLLTAFALDFAILLNPRVVAEVAVETEHTIDWAFRRMAGL